MKPEVLCSKHVEHVWKLYALVLHSNIKFSISKLVQKNLKEREAKLTIKLIKKRYTRIFNHKGLFGIFLTSNAFRNIHERVIATVRLK